MMIIHILEDIPPFVGLDAKVWRLRKGDLVTVGPGLPFQQADILTAKGVAMWVKPVRR